MCLHSPVGTPLDIEHHIAHHTRLANRHLPTIILKGLYHDQGHILPIPVHQVLAAQAQPSQGLTLGFVIFK